MWLKAREKLHIKIQKKKKKLIELREMEFSKAIPSKSIKDLKKNNIMREM